MKRSHLTGQLELIDQAKPTTLRDEYQAWRQTEFGREFFEACLAEAISLKMGETEHYSIDVLTGFIRHRAYLRHRPIDPRAIQFNNSYRPFLARELMETDERLRGLFETRRQKKVHKRPVDRRPGERS